MEYLERGSLRPFVGALTLPQVAGVLEGLLAGLEHAEARGIVHRDLKPENVMVSSSGTVKIADFGVAKALQADGTAPLTLSGTTVGTPAYMAPEQALAGSVGPATDLYAVGVIAYELLTGEVPFRDSDVALGILLQHLNDPVPSPRLVTPGLDPALSEWVERMLAKQPEARPAGAADAWDALDEIVVGLLGPRWGRQSRLTEAQDSASAAPARATAATSRLCAPRAPPASATVDRPRRGGPCAGRPRCRRRDGCDRDRRRADDRDDIFRDSGLGQHDGPAAATRACRAYRHGDSGSQSGRRRAPDADDDRSRPLSSGRRASRRRPERRTCLVRGARSGHHDNHEE